MKSLKTLGAVALLSTSMLGAATSFAADTSIAPDPGQAETPVKTKFKVAKDNVPNETPENPGNGDNQNKPLNPKGPFGIAYVPGSFTTTNYASDGETLADSGAQDFEFTNTNAHVGVKDKTHTKGGWELKAHLGWTGKQLPGATVNVASGSKVQINDGAKDGKNPTYKETSDVTTTTNGFSINESDQTIMTAKNLTEGVYDNTFDLGLGKVTLHIPDAHVVETGEYNGTVTWTLTATAVY